MRFFIEASRTPVGITDDGKPTPVGRSPNLPADRRTTEDYAIVSRVFHPDTHAMLVEVAGITQYGTDAAADLVTNPDLMAEALRGAPADWQKKNLQLVLHVKVISGAPSSPQVIAARFLVARFYFHSAVKMLNSYGDFAPLSEANTMVLPSGRKLGKGREAAEIGHLLQVRAVGVDQIQLKLSPVAVVLVGGEENLLAVRRERGREAGASEIGDLPRVLAVAVGHEQLHLHGRSQIFAQQIVIALLSLRASADDWRARPSACHRAKTPRRRRIHRSW